jgi:hypothetical protein
VVFAGDNTLNVYYFQPQLDGTFTKVQIYTDTKVQALEPIIRTRPIFGTSNVQLYAGAYIGFFCSVGASELIYP